MPPCASAVSQRQCARLAYVAAQPPGAHGELEAGEHPAGSPKTKTVMKRPARWCSGPSAPRQRDGLVGAAPAAGIPRFHLLLRGLQKLTNPNFFNAQSPSSIQAQLIAANRISPLHVLARPPAAVRHATRHRHRTRELAVGIGALLACGPASPLWWHGAVGMLFLTVSFTPPPITRARTSCLLRLDPLLIAVPGALARQPHQLVCPQRWAGSPVFVPSPSSSCRRCAATSTMATVRTKGRACTPRAAPTSPPAHSEVRPTPTRRPQMLVLGARPWPPRALSDSPPRASRGDRPDGGGAKSPNSGSARCPALRLGSTSTTLPRAHDHRAGGCHDHHHAGGRRRHRVGRQDVPVGVRPPSAALERRPGIDAPTQLGSFLAYDAICPHAGCTVGYSSAAKLIVCPCHGSSSTVQR